jgi:hypothetical protein
MVPKEYKVITCPVSNTLHLCDTPDKAVAYWHLCIATAPECFVVLLLTTCRRVPGHGNHAGHGPLLKRVAHKREKLSIRYPVTLFRQWTFPSRKSFSLLPEQFKSSLKRRPPSPAHAVGHLLCGPEQHFPNLNRRRGT